MLSITVLTYNQPHLLKDCLDSIDAQEIPTEHEKVLVANGGPKPAAREGWRVHYIPHNVGNIAGQNHCFQVAKGEWVLFVSDDVRLWPDCISKLLEFISRIKPDGQVMPEIRNLDGSIQCLYTSYLWPGYGINWRLRPLLGNPVYVPSICYFMRKTDWKEEGEFDEELPGAYEDVSMGIGMKTWLRGRCWIQPKSKATHLSNSTLKYTKADRWRFHKARLMVIDKHFRGMDRWARKAAVNVIDFLGSLRPST